MLSNLSPLLETLFSGCWHFAPTALSTFSANQNRKTPDTPLIHLFDLNGSDSSSCSSSLRSQGASTTLKYNGTRSLSFIELIFCIICFQGPWRMVWAVEWARCLSCSLAARPFIHVILYLNVHFDLSLHLSSPAALHLFTSLHSMFSCLIVLLIPTSVTLMFLSVTPFRCLNFTCTLSF